jgi:hypothetical protein
LIKKSLAVWFSRCDGNTPTCFDLGSLQTFDFSISNLIFPSTYSFVVESDSQVETRLFWDLPTAEPSIDPQLQLQLQVDLIMLPRR